jgi:hypothetical protein
MANKIGILTFHRCINYGSYWQARCLIDWLRSRGYDASGLDHTSREVEWAELRCAFRPHRPGKTQAADMRLYGQKVRGFRRLAAQMPLSRQFGLNDGVLMERFDTIIVGSDEVWNLAHPWYGRRPIFFGDRLNARRIVSYAASFGNFESDGSLEQPWAEGLGRFDAISVRDRNSQEILEHTLKKSVSLTADPVLLHPPKTRSKDRGRYIAVYGHDFSNGFAASVISAAKRLKLRSICIGYRNDWADEQWLSADPHEFAAFIAGSSAVATNFFHGCVFALRYSLPFVAEASWYRRNKISDLAALLGFEERIITDAATTDEIAAFLTDAPADGVNVRIDSLRRSSEQYLREALQ